MNDRLVFSQIFVLLYLFLGGTGTLQGFTPPAPEPDEQWDWIRLDTGEWLKGELKSLYEEEIEFDSDHFGIITIDWDDVEEIRSASDMEVRTSDRAIARGPLRMEGGTLNILEDGEPNRISKAEVVSIAIGSPREIDNWSFKAALGANFRTGNVEQIDYNARATIKRQTAANRFYWDYLGSFSETDEIETSNSHRSYSYFDLFLSNRFFFRPIGGEYFRDPFQNIAHRLTLGSSLGYKLIDTKDFAVDVTAGPAWQTLEYVTVAPGKSRSQSSFGGIFTALVEWDITGDIDFTGTYRAQVAPSDTGGLSLHADNTLELELTDAIDLNVSLIWDRTGSPAADSDGNTPDQDDFRLIFGLGLEL